MFFVSKVYPHHAGLNLISTACENSLNRLGTGRLNLYLLHWRGRIPLAETIEGMEKLKKEWNILGGVYPTSIQMIWTSYETLQMDEIVRQTH